MLTRPQVSPDYYELLEDTQLVIDESSGVLANDRDADGDRLTAIVETPALGTWDLQLDGSFRYLPPTNFNGLELAGYKADDGTQQSFEGLVQFKVIPVNDLPASFPDRFLTLVNEPLDVSAEAGVLANDVDVDGDPIVASLAGQAAHGRVSLAESGSFLYEPNVDFHGQDAFTYFASDGVGRGETVTVTIDVTSRPIVINELMASNATTLETRTRDDAGRSFRGESVTPDWIEIFNRHAQSIDLSGMHLTDDRGNPTKWQFPAGTTIQPNGYLVVFASGRNVVQADLDENGFLHTNFRLSGNGEYLALTTEEGRTVDELSDGYPAQVTDVSHGISPADESDTLAYFVHPTPGDANTDPRSGFVADTKFSVNRGFFTDPFPLEITSETPGATIRFTVDGSVPTEDHGQVYASAITIDRTTTLRAAAFHHEMVPTNVDTHTFLFLDDVLAQDQTPPEGYPSTWGGTLTDWGMDQDPDDLAKIAGDASFTLAEAQDVIKDSLLALPTMSLVTTVDDMFGSRNGIYSNTEGRGERWERPVSVEYIDPSGQEIGFQIDAGIRIQGFTSRNPSRNPKHSLRLVFRDEYGSPTLDYPLFGSGAADSFDTIVLRSNSQDAWVYDTSDNRQGQFIRDQWARDTLLAMGQIQPHGNWVHLYINGLYWGLYNPTERPDASFSASYLGGDKDNFDIVKNHEEVIDGTRDAYDELLAFIQNNPRNFSAGYRDLSSVAEYQRIQGNNPDGTRNPEYPVLLDVPSLIDYIIVGAYAAANDWPGNYYMGRDRTEDSAGFHFFMWDNEHGMKPSARTNRTVPHGRDNDSPTKFYHALRPNEEFQLQFADHLHRAFFNGGVLYVDPENSEWDPVHPERNMPAARWMELTGDIEESLIAEAVRWGDVRRTQYTPHDQFESLRLRLLRTWFPDRSATVLTQFQRLGLYPDHAAPVYSQHGGRITENFALTITNPNAEGQVFYSLDGSDPREMQRTYADPIPLTGTITVKSRILLNGEWSALNIATFSSAVPAEDSNLRVSEINYNPPPPSAAETDAGFSDNDDFEFIELANISDQIIDLTEVRLEQVNVDGGLEGVSFDFSKGTIRDLGPGEVVLVVEDLEAFEFRYGAELPVTGQWQGRLSNGGETITVMSNDAVMQQFAYSDEWFPETDGAGRSLESVEPAATDLQRWAEAAGWFASNEVGGSPGEVGTSAVPGDSNHDGVFSSSDLVLVFMAGEYEDNIPSNSTFETGDWDGDGEFTTSDLVFVFTAGSYVATAELGSRFKE